MLLDLPNINTNLPPPLRLNPSSHYHQQHHNQVHQTELLNNPGQVTNSKILKSIQSITEVMQQQLLLNSKTTEQGIVQTVSLFQEMIKPQEKRDLDPALLAEPENDKSNQQQSVICGSFTQVMVNPMQLQDHEFTAWLDRLVEARKNRQEKRQRPYRNFRKPYNEGKQNGDTRSKPPLRNRIKPAQEFEIQQIMDNFNCEYDDVVEAVDLYNLDVEECTTA